MAAQVGAIVVGAGVVGLAVARALAKAGQSPLILEGEQRFGTWTSSRNSEVIHAGIYYQQGSLKAQLCRPGNRQLYAFCAARGVPFRQLGKLIVAHDLHQLDDLHRLAMRARELGVDDLEELGANQVKTLEPDLACAGALLSPSTGIVDSYALMSALLGEAEANGAQLITSTSIDRIVRQDGMWGAVLNDGEVAVSSPIVVNCCGLAAQKMALSIEGLDQRYVPPIHYARGVYFDYLGDVPFDHLIYPLPEKGGLGTHLTLDISGRTRFGPDVEWVKTIDYTVDPARHARFVEAAVRIWPGVDPAKLVPGFAGIRPKLSGPGEPEADFVISGPTEHGCPGLINLFGIESPGLTSCLAIADKVLNELAWSPIT